MDELMDAMATDESPSQISDKIKEILFNKSAERIDAFKLMLQMEYLVMSILRMKILKMKN